MEKNIQSGWGKTSLYPFKLGVVLGKFMAKGVFTEGRPLLSKWFKSVLAATDWVRVEEELKGVVVDVFDNKVKELSNTIQSLAVMNTMLQSQSLRCGLSR